MMRAVVLGFFSVWTLPSSNAWAGPPHVFGTPYADGLLSTFIYGVLGIVMAAISVRILDLSLPGSIPKMIAEDKNVAVAIFVGLLHIGICIIVAAAIAG
jgi:uncharacterized membrane protein YjfL (UPF0719 family)